MSETGAAERWAIERSGGYRRRVLSMAMMAFLGLGLGLLLTAQQTTKYESTVRLLVGPIGADRSTLDAAGLLSRTYADVLSSRDAVARVADQLGVDVDVDDVTARSDERSRVILVIVTSDDRSVPPQVATELANGLIELIEDSRIATPAIPSSVNSAREPGQVRVLDQATDPAEPVRSSSSFVLFGTTVIGLLAGYVLATRVPTVRRTVDESFVEATGIPGLHILHRSDEGAEESSVDQVNAFDFAAVQLDLHCRRGGPYRSVAFIPVDEDEQTASVVLQLATAVARGGRSVEVVDADPDQRVFSPEIRSSDPADPRSRSAFRVRANAEREGEDPSAMARLRSILARTSKHSLVAVLTPPAGVSPVTFSTTVLVDRVVVIVRRNATRKAHFNEVMQTLESLDVTPVLLLETEITARAPEARFIVPIRPKPVITGGEEQEADAEDSEVPTPTPVSSSATDGG